MAINYLILGSSGYIAEAICNYLKHNPEQGRRYITLTRDKVDYTHAPTLEDYISMNINSGVCLGQRLVIINAAGYVGKPNVDACEGEIEATVKGNVVLPAQLADLCKRRSFPLVHISSGCIYNGYERVYTEDDPSDFDFRNGSVYSGSKAAAENMIRSIHHQSYIFRLRIPFDHHPSPRNYITKMLRYDKLLDAENSMTNREDFARSVISLVEQKVPYGTYNITNPGSMTTKEVIAMITEHISPGKEYQFFKDLEEFSANVIAPRSNCVLDTTKVEQFIDIPPLRKSMEDAIIQYGKQ